MFARSTVILAAFFVASSVASNNVQAQASAEEFRDQIEQLDFRHDKGTILKAVQRIHRGVAKSGGRVRLAVAGEQGDWQFSEKKPADQDALQQRVR
jgi:hypothetical protein